MNEPEDEGPNVPESSGGGESRVGQTRVGRFVERSGTTAGAIVAVAGFLLLLFYPIGFISFWWQLRRYYSFGAVTALYAASTVPSTVIGGSLVKVQQALSVSGDLTFNVFFLALVFYTLFRGLRLWYTASGGRRRWLYPAFLAAVSFWVIWRAAIPVIFACRFYVQIGTTAFLWYTGAWVVAAVGGLIGGYSAATVTSRLLRQFVQNQQSEHNQQSEQNEHSQQNEQNEQSQQNEQNEQSQQYAAGRDDASPWKVVIIAIAFSLVAAVISSTILAALQYPDLPSVRVQSKSSEYNDKRFALLSHSDNYWYVLNKEPIHDKKPQLAVLYAIPDDKVEQARFINDNRDTRGACPESVREILRELWERIMNFFQA